MDRVCVNTVTGPVPSDQLGITLMHEHILYGYPGWEGDQTIAPFDREAIVKTGVQYLECLKSFGVKTLVDATPLDGGRNPEIYREISAHTGVNIICSTGYYYEGGGASAYFKLRNALSDATSEIVELLVKEITEGIRDTGIKPGVIKIGSGNGVITDYERMMFKAAARAQKETGVPIITHTEQGTMGPEQAELLISEGADPARIQIGHMSDNLDMEYHLRVLRQGVYAAWDRMGLQGLAGCPLDEERYPVILDLLARGHGDRLMLSHDFVSHWLGRPRKYPAELLPLLVNRHPGSLFTIIIPALRQGGASEGEINTILVENPRRFFTGEPDAGTR